MRFALAKGRLTEKFPYTLGLFIIVALVILGGGFIYYQNSKQNALHKAEEMLASVAELKVEELSRWREERRGDADLFIQNHAFSTVVAAYLKSPNSPELQQELRDWLESLINHNQYDRVLLLDEQGNPQFKEGRGQDDDNFSLIRKRSLEVLQSQQCNWVDFHLNVAVGNVCVGLLIPIRNPNPDLPPIAVIALRIDPLDYLYPYITSWPVLSETGETLLVRREGNEVVYLSPLRFKTNNQLNTRYSLDKVEIPSVQVVKGARGTVHGTDYRGAAIIANVKAVPNSPWYLVARMDRAEILKPVVLQARLLVLLLAALLILLAGGIVHLFRRNKIQSLEHELSLMDALKESEESLYITLYSIGDAVIATDKEGRISRMNKVAETLTGWTLNDARQKPLTEVFVIINAETRQPVSDPVARVLETGKVVGLANHTVLVSRNGAEYQIADSAAPIRDSAGAVRGVILVFSDVTEKYQAEADLRASEAQLRRAVMNSPFPIMIHAEGGEVVMISDSWTEISGYTLDDIPSTATWAEKAYGLRSELVSEDIERLFTLKGRDHVGEYTIRTKSGKEVIWDFSSSPLGQLRDGRRTVLSMAMDVTKRKQAESALLRSEAEYRRLFTSMPDGYALHQMIYDEAGKPVDYRFLAVNPAFERLTGIKADTVIGHTVRAIMPNTESIWIERYGRVARTGEPAHFEELSRELDRYYEVQAFQPQQDHFAVVFTETTSRKRAEIALRREREFLNTILDAQGVLVVILDLNGRILRLNPACEALTGYTFADLSGQPIWETVIVQEDRDSIREFFAHATVASFPHQRDNSWLGKDGVRHMITWSNTCLLDDEGRINRIISCGVDITARIKAETELAIKERSYQEIFHATNDAIIIHDAETGEVLDVNDTMLKMYGYEDKCAVIGNEVVNNPQGKEPVYNASRAMEFIKLAAVGDPQLFEWYTIKTDGSPFWVEVSLKATEIGGGHCVLAVVRDITERKRAEDTLRDSEERFRLMFDNAPLGYQSLDAEGRFIDVNQAWLDTLGYTHEEVIGKWFGDFLAPEYVDAFQKRFPCFLAEGKVHTEFEMMRKDGQRRFIAFDGRIGTDLNGEFKQTHGILKDITEQRRAEQELITARERAEESDRLKSAFLANMSHEIRTPMNGIMGFTELLKDPTIAEKDRAEFIQIIEESSARLLNIINDLIDISKIEAGQMELHLESTSLNDLLESLHAFFTPEATRKGLKLYCETGLALGQDTIQTDSIRLGQILTNLIKNAIKFTEKGSIRFGYTLDEGVMQFYIQDTGIGIEPALTGKLFERFRQGSTALSRPYEGAGLGLSIAKALVELLHGKIWYESAVNVGTSVYFTLPYTALTLEQTEPVRTAKDVPVIPQTLTILVVEDDPHNRRLITTLLHHKGVKHLLACNGAEAVAMIADHPEIDLILMDIKMPVMDGLEATRIIKQKRKDLPIIGLSAFAMEADEKAAREAGCDDYLSKPVSLSTLMERLGKFTGKVVGMS